MVVKKSLCYPWRWLKIKEWGMGRSENFRVGEYNSGGWVCPKRRWLGQNFRISGEVCVCFDYNDWRVDQQWWIVREVMLVKRIWLVVLMLDKSRRKSVNDVAQIMALMVVFYWSVANSDGGGDWQRRNENLMPMTVDGGWHRGSNFYFWKLNEIRELKKKGKVGVVDS